ncbi:MAG: hypothetical protein WC205_05140 [Opitutaceae bacterium]
MTEHWYDTTALDDLLGIGTASVNDARLYRALDKLGAHKDALCAHLMERYRQWFGVRFEFLLYDVTSTYFEGEAERPTPRPSAATPATSARATNRSASAWSARRRGCP